MNWYTAGGIAEGLLLGKRMLVVSEDTHTAVLEANKVFRLVSSSAAQFTKSVGYGDTRVFSTSLGCRADFVRPETHLRGYSFDAVIVTAPRDLLGGVAERDFRVMLRAGGDWIWANDDTGE